MEGDRTRSLMVRAAAEGVIDYGCADPLDSRWWRKHWWLIGEVSRSSAVGALSATHRHIAALLANSTLDGDGFKETQKLSYDVASTLNRLYHPWEREKTTTERIDEGMARYERTFSKPGTPKHELAKAQLLAWFESNLRNPPDG